MSNFKYDRILGIYLLIQIICVLNSDGAAFFTTNAVHPDYPGKCYFEGPPVTTLSIGETKRLSQSCVKISCYPEFRMSVLGCGVTPGGPVSCVSIPGDIRRPYPHCCDEVIC